ncbi:hypothetical protein [Streptomyces griseus]|uniref:hypothetical protein n=1 Tax=Streptomyces griseus TaxID=1911 RepID=UPI00158607ED|nr:hypothetical protein [Streptomyces griseus]
MLGDEGPPGLDMVVGNAPSVFHGGHRTGRRGVDPEAFSAAYAVPAGDRRPW